MNKLKPIFCNLKVQPAFFQVKKQKKMSLLEVRRSERKKIEEVYCPSLNKFVYQHIHIHGIAGTLKSTTVVQTLEQVNVLKEEDQQPSPIQIVKFNSICFQTLTHLYKVFLSKLDYQKKKYIKGLDVLIDAVSQQQSPVCFLVKNIHEIEDKHVQSLVGVITAVYEATDAKVTLCTTGQRSLPPHGQLLQIYMPTFTKSQINEIVLNEFKFNSKFISAFVSSLYDGRHVRSLLTIMQNIAPVHEEFAKAVKEIRCSKPDADPASIENMQEVSTAELAKAWSSLSVCMKQIILKVSRDPVLRGTQSTLNSGLSEIQQYLLIGAYLASNTDAKKDTAMFGKVKTSVKKGRKGNLYSTSITKMKKKKEFDLIRLLAIVNILIMNQNSVRIPPLFVQDILPCVRDLVLRQYLLPHGTTSVRVRGSKSTTELNLEKVVFVLSDIIDHEKVVEMCKVCEVELDGYFNADV